MTSWPQLQAKIHEFGGAAEGVLAAFTDDLDRRPVPRVLYHYTNEEGLYGILKSGSIRLSDLFYQNDPSELQHGIDYALAPSGGPCVPRQHRVALPSEWVLVYRL